MSGAAGSPWGRLDAVGCGSNGVTLVHLPGSRQSLRTGVSAAAARTVAGVQPEAWPATCSSPQSAVRMRRIARWSWIFPSGRAIRRSRPRFGCSSRSRTATDPRPRAQIARPKLSERRQCGVTQAADTLLDAAGNGATLPARLTVAERSLPGCLGKSRLRAQFAQAGWSHSRLRHRDSQIPAGRT